MRPLRAEACAIQPGADDNFNSEVGGDKERPVLTAFGNLNAVALEAGGVSGGASVVGAVAHGSVGIEQQLTVVVPTWCHAEPIVRVVLRAALKYQLSWPTGQAGVNRTFATIGSTVQGARMPPLHVPTKELLDNELPIPETQTDAFKALSDGATASEADNGVTMAVLEDPACVHPFLSLYLPLSLYLSPHLLPCHRIS